MERYMDLLPFIKAGLRRDYKAKSDVPGMEAMYNVRPTPYGCISIAAPTNPFATQPTVSGGFPQLFLGTNVALLADETELHYVDTYSWDRSTFVTVHDAANRSQLASIGADGGLWQFVDMGSLWALFNEENMIFKSGRDVIEGNADKIYNNTLVRMKTGAFITKRLMFGGFEPALFWPEDWNQRWIDWWEKTQLTSLGQVYADQPTNSVGWTSIGLEDLWLWLDPEWAKQGYMTEYEVSADGRQDYYWYLIYRNELGFCPMPWEGDVLRIETVGSKAVVFGDNGIAFMIPIWEPTSTFRCAKVSDLGIMHRTAAGVGLNECIFIRRDGSLCRITDNIEVLGYRWIFENYTDGEFSIVYDAVEDEWHITYWPTDEPPAAYILTRSGLCNDLAYFISGGKANNGAFVATYLSYLPYGSGYSKILLTTSSFHCDAKNHNTQYTVKRIEASATFSSDRMLESHLYTKDAPFDYQDLVSATEVNVDGVAYHGFIGREFRIGLYNTARSGSSEALDDRFSISNLRHVYEA